MAEYDSVSEMKVAEAIPFVAHNAAINGNSIDTLGFESLTFAIQAGTLGTGTVNFLMQEADDNGSGAPGAFTTVAAGDMIGTLPTILATDDNKSYRIGYIGKKQWVRINNVGTGWTSVIHGVIAILGNPKTGPVAAQVA